jgi:hypothetical protein
LSHLSCIDTALVRLLGKDFSILDTPAKPIASAFIKHVFGLAPGAQGGAQTPAVLKAQTPAVLQAQLDVKLDKSYWKCLVSPGVAYRNSPSFGDRCEDPRGPENGAIIHAVRLVGPHADWIKIELQSHGTKYLPIRNEEQTETFFESSKAPISVQEQALFLDSKVAQSVLFSNPAFVLSINMLSLILVRVLSSKDMTDFSQIAVLQFLLRLVEIGPSFGSSAPLPARMHTFVEEYCMICKRCTF